MSHYSIEVTDTFGGEANYCWVRRGTTQATSRRGQIEAAKRVAGWACRVKVVDFGDMIEVRPVSTAGLLQVAFVTYRGDHEA